MPKTNAKVQSVGNAIQSVNTKYDAIADSRTKLGKLLKDALAAKTFADFDKTSTKTFLAVKEVEKEVKELPHLVTSLKSELSDLNKLVMEKGKSTTYKLQLAASKSKATAFKGVVQFTKDSATARDEAEQHVATLGKEGLGERYYAIRNKLKDADPKKFPAELSKQVKELIDMLSKNDIKGAGTKTAVADAKRLSADPDLDDDD